MKKLSTKEINKYQAIIVNEWKTHRLYEHNAIVEFPLGELTDNLQGFAWAWKLKGIDLTPKPITNSDRFNAQGLEGKISINTDLASAVTVYSQCNPNRCQIFANV